MPKNFLYVGHRRWPTSATDVGPTSANVMLPLYLGTSGAAVNADVGPT